MDTDEDNLQYTRLYKVIQNIGVKEFERLSKKQQSIIGV